MWPEFVANAEGGYSKGGTCPYDERIFREAVLKYMPNSAHILKKLDGS
jgi:hypothetical protein